MIKGSLTIDLSKKISDCGNDIDESIKDSEALSKLTEAQRIEISNIVHFGLLGCFDALKLNIQSGEAE